jgi:hypothetical protein
MNAKRKPVVADPAPSEVVVIAAPPADPLAETMAALSKDPALLQRVSEEAHRAYQAARRGMGPTLVDKTWLAVKHQYSMIARQIDPMYPNHAPALRLRAQMVQVALQATAAFEEHRKLTAPQIAKALQDDKQRVVTAMHQHNLAHAASCATPVVFSAAVAVQQLSAAGITLTVSAEGALKASPSGRLNDAQRSVMIAHKAALVSYLQSAETIA